MEHEAALIEDPEILHTDFLNRGRFYQKGFAVYIQGLINDLDFWRSGDRRDELVDDMRHSCFRMKSIYERLIGEGLRECPDADLLLPIDTLIQELSLALEKIILGQTDIEKAIEILRTIFQNSYQFRLRLIALQNELRSCPGYENTRLSGRDIFGKEWASVL
ncbi:hypothetical protein A3J23_02675 [Candidatus Peregrinibacteria bacterium RIFCSPLOWO2_02_FULL_48_14]|nr:MAG: hypothetical protein A2974_01960 [Candidatus Peregrinibacteria bacterium RIFCSPLOWO2_01_FULL_48_20]OGJ46014.1 MAG: hypothetical protein A3J23_02675 [Candidatus Peregrinibacteria bacterium RIFCSPLOWO2_02_FULL_48_14]